MNGQPEPANDLAHPPFKLRLPQQQSISPAAKLMREQSESPPAPNFEGKQKMRLKLVPLALTVSALALVTTTTARSDLMESSASADYFASDSTLPF